jgi:hypothetical protein
MQSNSLQIGLTILSYFILGYFQLFVVILLVTIIGYSIGGYYQLFY